MVRIRLESFIVCRGQIIITFSGNLIYIGIPRIYSCDLEVLNVGRFLANGILITCAGNEEFFIESRNRIGSSITTRFDVPRLIVPVICLAS